MPISNSYPSGIPIEDQDLFVGTKAYNNRTVNYTAQGVADYLNINSKVAIGGQMSFQFTIVPNIPKTIAFEGGGGNNTAFSAITKLIVSAIDVSTANITIFLNYLNNSQVLLSQQNQPNFFGHYKITGYTQIGTSAFYELDLEFIGGNGTIIDKQYYDLVSFVLSTEVPIPTLQEVTDTGAITTDTITVGGITSGNFYSDGYSFGLSDNYDTNYNFLYQPFSGLQITDTINYIYLYQDASIGFQNALGSGNLRSDLVTGLKTWQFPDASGTLALTSNIGTWGALNYPTWTTGTPFVKMTAAGTFALDTTLYYPYPTGTISQYIRGDGTLATFPSVATPTLQQVTTAGNTTTDSIFLQSGLSPNSVILSNGYISLSNNITNRQITISTSNDISFSDGAGNSLYLKSPTTITATNTQTLQNASGTIALLSDIPTGGVTSVGLTMPSAFTVTNSPITSSGNIAVTGAGLVSQYVRGDGTLANFPNSTGGGSSVNYYLNGSVSQGTFGGTTYYQMSKTPILGTGTNFIRTNGAGNGYIASFITDAGDPSFLNIPGGNWNVEFYFNASASGGSPSFYAELYKVSATNVFTLIASDSLNPEGITNGTTIDQYFTSIPVPQTTLLVTDRLAVRIFVNTGGRTITLHTENGNLSEVLTTFTTGLTALNGLTDQVQFFDVGTGATNFNISSSGDTHTFNLLFNIRRNANNSSNNNINYNGYAVTGSAESSAVWTITRLTIAASGSITVATATNVAWTDRETTIYT
jgi:hypothetical protein